MMNKRLMDAFMVSRVIPSRSFELLIAPITMPTINMAQTMPTTLERLSSSDTSTSKAAKGVELALKQMP
jgi:hypothetical protein